MEVICIDEKAFFALFDKVVEHLKTTHGITENKWITDAEAMPLLNITSKTTLQKLRDEGEIRFTQGRRKNILYDRASIDEYHERHAQNPFNHGK